MRISRILFIASLIITTSTFGQSSKKVLFLGNSYTNSNSLTSIISSLASNMGDTLISSENTPGGYTLQGHSTDPASLGLINQIGWDFVVLQEQSQKPSWPISQVTTDVFPYAVNLCNAITQSNPCAKPLFFMTWGRKNGDAGNCPNWPPVCTYNGMDSLLNLRYRMMADSNQAVVSPVGAVWHYIRDNHPQIELYSPDESHPSLTGSYAAACTFYTLIFQRDPSLITDNYGLDQDIAINIRNAAKLIAFDSLSMWSYINYSPSASYTYTQNANTVQFSNNSVNANTYIWTFGDGNSSSVFEPIHTYAQDGTYNILLQAENCGNLDTLSSKLIILPDALKINSEVNTLVYPNPTNGQIIIRLNQNKAINNIKIFSNEGRKMKEFNGQNLPQVELDIFDLADGLYILHIQIDGVVYKYSIIKN